MADTAPNSGEIEQVCPGCGGPVEPSFTCHTWPRRRDDGSEQWMSCLPCDSAVDWDCWPTDADDDGCGWSWTDGLNPRNPRAEANEAKRPTWASLIGSLEADGTT